MEIKNNKPAEGSEPRRFSAGRAVAKPGASSFASALKKATETAPAAKDGASALPDPAQPIGNAAPPQAEAQPKTPAEGNPPAPKAETSSADPDAAFADHMELVRFRLKTGYYASKAINDALTDKLSGYFDELA